MGRSIENIDFELYEEIIERRDRAQNALSALTSREREVAILVSQGLKSDQIAEILDVAVRTVDVFRAKILKKLRLTNSVQLGVIVAEATWRVPSHQACS